MRTYLLFLSVLVLGGPDTLGQGKEQGQSKGQQQGKQQGQGKDQGPRALKKEELADKLDRFKIRIAGKMVPERVVDKGARTRKTQQARWLAGFQVVQSQHYLVYTDGPKATCRKFASSLERLHRFIKKRFPFQDPSHHLECYIFKTEEEYFDFCVKLRGWTRAEAMATAGHASAHYYATYYQSPTAATVMHEAAHQVADVCLKVPGVGSWFQEGFAVYIENKILNASVSGNMKSDLRSGRFYSFSHLVGLNSLLEDEHGDRNYEHAGAILEFLIETKLKPVKGRFPEFLRAARRTWARGPKVTERLFQKVYGLSIDEVEVLWKKHFDAPKAQPK